MASVDPTAIPIEFDPRERRMRGTAVHGNVWFDVPFISHIEGNLYQGGCQNGLVLPHDIQFVISLYQWERYKQHPALKGFLEVEMYDTAEGEPDEDNIRGLASVVNECKAIGPTLVHCQAGLNRSGLVAAYSLMLEGRTADEAISLLRETRSQAVLCNPTFEAWLRARG